MPRVPVTANAQDRIDACGTPPAVRNISHGGEFLRGCPAKMSGTSR
jgi:hypothetical protein